MTADRQHTLAYNWPHTIRYTPPYNWPHTTLQPASPPTPLQGERGVVCFVVTAVRCLSSAHATLQLASHHPTTSLTPDLSPRGEGSSMLLQRILLGAYPQLSASPPFHARGGGVISLVLLQCTLFLQGISLPSPLGEGLGVRPVVCCSFSFSFCLYLSLPNMRSRYRKRLMKSR